MSIIKFTEDPTLVRLSRATGNRTEGKWGTQFVWECANGDDIFYASEQFNALLTSLSISVDQNIKIKKVPKTDINGKEWSVFAVDIGDGVYKTLDDLKTTAPPAPEIPSIDINSVDDGLPSASPIGMADDVFKAIDDRLVKIEKHLGLLENASRQSVTEEDIPF